MTVVLVVRPGEEEVWLRTSLRQLFDRVEQAPLDTVLSAYDIIIPGDHSRDLALVQRPDIKVAMRCTDLDGLLYWRERNIGLDTIFSPSALALLEANERTRQTLVLARDLAQGEILTETDLASAVGGPGLGADRRDIVIGLRALYPLKAGTPVDFGLIG